MISELKRASSQRYMWVGTLAHTWVCSLILAKGLLSLQGKKFDPREPETVSRIPKFPTAGFLLTKKILTEKTAKELTRPKHEEWPCVMYKRN